MLALGDGEMSEIAQIDHSLNGVGEDRFHARALLDGSCGQASEGVWGMPGHTKARKAAVSCEKLGGVAHRR